MTSDSMSARPMIIDRRIAPAAPGLRAIPSHAAAIALACPMAPAAAAIPRTNAAEMAPHFTPPVPAAASCANAETEMSVVARSRMMFFLFTPNLLPFLISKPELVFFRCDGAADVHHRQHDEDECLEECAEDSEAHHRPGKDERQHAHEDPGGGVLTEDVAEEAHAQREDACEVADHFDREHERGQKWNRPHEVLEVVPQSLPANAFRVEVEERGERQRERRVDVARRRLQEEEESEDVRDEDEHHEAADDVEVAVSVMSDDVVQQVFDAADDHLQDVLKRTGIVAADVARRERKNDRRDHQDQQRHDHVVRNVPRPTMLHAVPERVYRTVEN